MVNASSSRKLKRQKVWQLLVAVFLFLHLGGIVLHSFFEFSHRVGKVGTIYHDSELPAKPVIQKGLSTLLLKSDQVPAGIREVMNSYRISSGANTYFGFFSPNVPFAGKVVAELTYEDGSTATVIPEFGTFGMSMRMNKFISAPNKIDLPELGDATFMNLGRGILAEHPDAVEMTLVVGTIVPPSVDMCFDDPEAPMTYRPAATYLFHPVEP